MKTSDKIKTDIDLRKILMALAVDTGIDIIKIDIRKTSNAWKLNAITNERLNEVSKTQTSVHTKKA